MKYGEATMGQFEAVINKLGGMEGLKRFLAGKLVVVKVSSILKHLATVSVSAVEQFVAADHFVIFTSANAKVKIGFLGDHFKTHFLPKIERDVPAAELAVHTLTRNSLDGLIREELGADYEETTLAHLYQMLSRQPKGESGTLLTNGGANIFYVRDASGSLWAVSVRWDSYYGYWRVYASSVGHPSEWNEGNQVVSQVGRT